MLYYTASRVRAREKTMTSKNALLRWVGIDTICSVATMVQLQPIFIILYSAYNNI